MPGNVGDIGGMIATALSVYGKVGDAQAQSMAKRLADRKEEGEVVEADRRSASQIARDDIVADFDKATEHR